MPRATSYLNKTGEVGLFIRQQREKAKMSRETLATKLGYSNPPNMIILLENRRAKFPLARWKAFADALNIPPHEMLKRVLSEALPDALPYLSFHKEKSKKLENSQEEEKTKPTS